MKTTMKKVFVTAALIAGVTAGAFAQAYEQGAKQLNVGVGIGSTLTASGLKSSLPPIGISFEYGATEKISAGGYVGYSGASQEVPSYGGSWKFSYSYIVIGARGSYHFATSDKLDPYAGVIIGYNVASVTTEKPSGYTGPDLPSASAGGAVIGGHLGARYLFTDHIGAFAELGYGIAWLNLGLTAKF